MCVQNRIPNPAQSKGICVTKMDNKKADSGYTNMKRKRYYTTTYFCIPEQHFSSIEENLMT